MPSAAAMTASVRRGARAAREAGEEVPGDAREAVAEEQCAEERLGDAGVVGEQGADEGVREEVAGHEREGEQQPGPHAAVAAGERGESGERAEPGVLWRG